MLTSSLFRRVKRSSTCFPQRTLFTETVQGFANVFLDSAIALPYPPEWPAYTTSIILTGILSRAAIFPFLYWSWKRERRLDEEVLPYLRAYHAKLKNKALHEVEKASSIPEAHRFYSQAIKQKLHEKRRKLLKQHKCSPWFTMAISPVSQLPMFVLLSSTFLYISNEPGSVFRNEAVFTLQSLAHPDPTAVIPVMTGLVSLVTTETSSWFIGQRKDSLKPIPASDDSDKPTGDKRITISPARYIKSVIRVLSLGRVVLTFMVPGSVGIYWLTSAICGLLTNWVLNYMTSRRRLRLARPQIG